MKKKYTNIKLRDYQKQAIVDIRNAFKKSKSVFYTLPTGGGKTVLFSEIAKQAINKNKNTWIICPRNELIWQAHESLNNIGCTTGIISPGFNEDNNSIHIVSKDTWIRRKKKIIRKPDFVIVDEGHLSTDRYLQMQSEYPNANFLFVSATPERLDGKDLSKIAKELVFGPSIEWMMDNKYLSKIDYYCPPVSGFENIKRIGTEFDYEQLEEWIHENKIYGRTIDQFKKYCTNKPCIVFCRNIKHSKLVSEKFNNAGFKFENIDGTMARKKIKYIISAVRDGKLDGLTSCELVTYGLDVPKIKSIVMLRPTLSRALYYQMLGRGLRFTTDNDHCVVLDQVGNAFRCCNGQLPWIQPDWNYYGRKKTKKNITQLDSIKYCPYIEFMPCIKKTCLGCEHNHTKKPIGKFVEIDGELVPMVSEIKLEDRCKEEKDFYNKRIKKIKDKSYYYGISKKHVIEMLTIAKEIRRKPLWVYFHLATDNKINKNLLGMIQSEMGYKKGWLFTASKIINSKKRYYS